MASLRSVTEWRSQVKVLARIWIAWKTQEGQPRPSCLDWVLLVSETGSNSPNVNLPELLEVVWGPPGSKNFQIAGPIMNRISWKPTRFSVKNKEEQQRTGRGKTNKKLFKMAREFSA